MCEVIFHCGFDLHFLNTQWDFPGGSVVKNLSADAEDADVLCVRKMAWRRRWRPTLGFCLGNSTDRGGWKA